MWSSATPRLYQEIRERGLNSTIQDELLDDFVVVEAPVEDQAIVVKSYRPVQLTWSQLPQVDFILPWEKKALQSGTPLLPCTLSDLTITMIDTWMQRKMFIFLVVGGGASYSGVIFSTNPIIYMLTHKCPFE